MLTLVGKKRDGEIRHLPSFLEMELYREEGVPADAIEVLFPYFAMQEIVQLYVYREDVLLFSAYVDEIHTYRNENGMFTKCFGRSAEAILLDNEAEPNTFYDASPSVIFEKYIKPCGLSVYFSEGGILEGAFLAEKGMSVYEVLCNYCRNLYGTLPYISQQGELFFSGKNSSEKIIFFDSASKVQKGKKYTEFERAYFPCNFISGVYVKTSEKNGYKTFVKNPVKDTVGYARTRCVNASLLNTPANTAYKMIELTNKQLFAYKVICKAFYFEEIGTPAEIYDSAFGSMTGLTISGVHISVGSEGTQTEIMLRM